MKIVEVWNCLAVVIARISSIKDIARILCWPRRRKGASYLSCVAGGTYVGLKHFC